jgi:hypothetical protein
LAKLSIQAGSISETVDLFIQNSSSTTGAGLTGLTSVTAGLTCYYNFRRGNSTALTMKSLATATSSWNSGGFFEIDATNQPGIYRFDVPDALLAAGNGRYVKLYLQGAANMAPCVSEIELTGWDNQKKVEAAVWGDHTTGGTGTGQLTDFDAVGTIGYQLLNLLLMLNDARVASLDGIPFIREGSAQAGGASTITLDSGASATDNTYQDALVRIVSGTGAGQSRSIQSYVGATKVATVFPAWTTVPDSSSQFVLTAFGQVDVGNWANVAVTGMPMPTYTQPTGFLAEDFGELDADVEAIQASTAGLTFTSAGKVDASVRDWVGDAIPARNVTGVPLVDMKYDGGVLQTAGDLMAAISNIAVTTAALNSTAASATYTTGTDSGGVANTATADGVYDSVTDTAGTTDFYYQFSLGSTGQTAVGVNWLGYVVGVVNTIKVYAWNWGNSAWDQVGTIIGISGTANMSIDWDLTSAHTGTGGNVGLVRVRFNGTGLVTSNVKTDRILCGYVYVQTFPTNFSALGISAAGKINEVVLTDTLTTYTGNTLQTADVANVKTVTDKFAFTVANQVDANCLKIGGTTQTGADVGLLSTEINADVDELIVSVASIPTNPYTGTPPTTTQIASAVWQDHTSAGTGTGQGSDFDVAGTVGYDLANLLGMLNDQRVGWLDNLNVGGLVASHADALAVDADVLTRAPSATALSTANWTNGRAANLDNLDALVSSRSTYAGGDTAGTTTLLARLTAARAGWLDNLSGGAVALASGVVVTTNNDKAGYALSAAGADLIVVAGEKLTEALRYIGSSVAGVISGAGTGTEVFKDFAGNPGITVTADASGNRTAVALN